MTDTVAKPKILVVDDEPGIVGSIIRLLEEEFDCLGAASAQEARVLLSDPLAAAEVACIVSDQRMPGETGADFLAFAREACPDAVRILLTGYSDFDSVVAAVNKGRIHHFLQKPWEPVQLEIVVRQGARLHGLCRENRRLAEELARKNQSLERENASLKREAIAAMGPFKSLIGLGPAMEALRRKLQSLIGSHSTVLVTGESGTGKELVARALHFSGPRRDKPFVAQNCAALPESILESELFGHVKGAFTHALENRIGILESAHQGTLFLDEIGDMPLAMQAKLLRFLQEGVFHPLGSRVERKVDVRIIAATHRDLEAMAEAGTFRADLFYRLNVIPLKTPSLRDRPEDIPLLAEHFLKLKAARLSRTPPVLSPSALGLLQCHPFPGNVRELENAVEYALNMMGDRETVLVEDLPDRLRRTDASPGTGGGKITGITGGNGGEGSGNGRTEGMKGGGATGGNPDRGEGEAQRAVPAGGTTLEDAVLALEADLIQKAMKASAGNISQAARLLGLSRQGLHNKLAKHGMKEGPEGPANDF